MYKKPSRRAQARAKLPPPDLVPIMDSVFIFIFFLLMSASFIKIFEIPSDVPFFSDITPPENKEKPLALTIQVTDTEINILTGLPSSLLKTIRKLNQHDYDLNTLHESLLALKKKYPKESMAILEPETDLSYETIVQIMDEIRLLRKTDPEFFLKDKTGQEKRLKTLFAEIIFGNIQS